MRTELVQHVVGGGQTLQKDTEEPWHLHPWGCLNACSDLFGPAPSRTLGERHPELFPSLRYCVWLFGSCCVCRMLGSCDVGAMVAAVPSAGVWEMKGSDAAGFVYISNGFAKGCGGVLVGACRDLASEREVKGKGVMNCHGAEAEINAKTL